MAVKSIVKGNLLQEVTFERRPEWLKEGVLQADSTACTKALRCNEVDMFGEQQGGCPGWGRGGKGAMEGNEDGDPSGPGLSYECYSARNEEPWSGSSQGVTRFNLLF